MDRRTAIKRMLAGFAGTLAWANGSRLTVGMRSAAAQTLSQKTMVLIFQRGGCDGLSVTVPYGDTDYALLRPTIRIPSPDAANQRSALNLDGFFGLNPSLRGLHDIFADGNLAVFPAVHYDNASRSHFDSQFIIESGAHNVLDGGFLNRYLEKHPNDATFRAVSMGTSIADSLRGDIVVPAVDAIDGFGFPEVTGYACEGYQLAEKLNGVYTSQTPGAGANRTLVFNQAKKMFQDMEVFASFEEDYQPANSAIYPDTTYGRHLRIIAQLIKEDVGLEIAAVSIGGWDTHSGQGNGSNPGQGLARSLGEFGDGIKALYQDLGAKMSDVVLVTGTEFGRTAEENANGGTDHGHASSWFVAGGGVDAGIKGGWPGLSADKLNEGRYLDNTVDYRDILGGIIRGHLNSQDLAPVFPGHTYKDLHIFG